MLQILIIFMTHLNFLLLHFVIEVQKGSMNLILDQDWPEGRALPLTHHKYFLSSFFIYLQVIGDNMKK